MTLYPFLESSSAAIALRLPEAQFTISFRSRLPPVSFSTSLKKFGFGTILSPCFSMYGTSKESGACTSWYSSGVRTSKCRSHSPHCFRRCASSGEIRSTIIANERNRWNWGTMPLRSKPVYPPCVEQVKAFILVLDSCDNLPQRETL
jgi:hypothetical protein